MPTSIHIPKPLLNRVDRRARRLRVSRNRFIVQTLERALAQEVEWSPDFLAKVRRFGEAHTADVDEMVQAIVSRRASKGPPHL